MHFVLPESDAPWSPDWRWFWCSSLVDRRLQNSEPSIFYLLEVTNHDLLCLIVKVVALL
jgi:hypothetical protein